MQSVFDPPMGADDLIELFGGHRFAKNIIGCVLGFLTWILPRSVDFANAGQTRPLMCVAEPFYIG